MSSVLVESDADFLTERSREIESAGQLPEGVVAELRARGVFRLLLPAELGGRDATPLAAVDTIERLAHSDGAVGWCSMIGAGNNTVASRLPEVGAREVFVTGDEIVAGSFAPNGHVEEAGDCYVISGRWSFGSGITHSDWVSLGAMVEGRPSLLFAPRHDVQVHDTWDVAGLQGTGSHDFSVNGVVIPKHRCIALGASPTWSATPLHRLPVYSLLAPLMGGVAIGIAQRALDELLLLADKVPFQSTKALRDRETTQCTIARAEAAVGSARAYLRDSVATAWERALSGDEFSLRDRAVVRLATVNAAQTGAEVAKQCYQAGGGTALYRTSPLQRTFRDAFAATQHFIVAASAYEAVGKALVGLPTEGPL